MRVESTLDVAPEGSLSDLPAVIGGDVALEGNNEHKKPLRLR